jgi:hypothetical protein
MFSAGLSTPAADGSQERVSPTHAGRLEDLPLSRMAPSLPPDPGAKEKRPHAPPSFVAYLGPFLFPVGDTRIRSDLADSLSAQGLMMISPPAQAGTSSRRPEHKSFIHKLLESKTRFIVPSDGMVTGHFSGEPGAGRCRSSGRWPVPRVWAAHPNPALRPKQPSFWPPFPPTLHGKLLRAAPEPRRSLAGTLFSDN